MLDWIHVPLLGLTLRSNNWKNADREEHKGEYWWNDWLASPCDALFVCRSSLAQHNMLSLPRARDPCQSAATCLNKPQIAPPPPPPNPSPHLSPIVSPIMLTANTFITRCQLLCDLVLLRYACLFYSCATPSTNSTGWKSHKAFSHLAN